MSNLGKTIKLIREEYGLSQNELASKMGLRSGQYVSNVERGVSKASINFIRAATKALRLRKSLLFEVALEDIIKDYKQKYM